MGWSHDEGEWFDEEVDTSDIMEWKCFLETVFCHAPIVSIPKGADIREGDRLSGNLSDRKDGDIGCPIPIVARFLGEEEECASDTDEK